MTIPPGWEALKHDTSASTTLPHIGEVSAIVIHAGTIGGWSMTFTLKDIGEPERTVYASSIHGVISALKDMKEGVVE